MLENKIVWNLKDHCIILLYINKVLDFYLEWPFSKNQVVHSGNHLFPVENHDSRDLIFPTLRFDFVYTGIVDPPSKQIDSFQVCIENRRWIGNMLSNWSLISIRSKFHNFASGLRLGYFTWCNIIEIQVIALQYFIKSIFL